MEQSPKLFKLGFYGNFFLILSNNNADFEIWKRVSRKIAVKISNEMITILNLLFHLNHIKQFLFRFKALKNHDIKNNFKNKDHDLYFLPQYRSRPSQKRHRGRGGGTF